MRLVDYFKKLKTFNIIFTDNACRHSHPIKYINDIPNSFEFSMNCIPYEDITSNVGYITTVLFHNLLILIYQHAICAYMNKQ